MKKSLIIIILSICLISNVYPYPAEDVSIITGNEYFTAVKSLIANAQSSIYITMYIMTFTPDYPKTISNQLIYELVKAKKRGVDVRVIMDQDRGSALRGQYNDLAFFYLKDNGINVDYDIPSQKLHNKLVIIDDKITVIGSHNWSNSALKDNKEASVIIKSPEVAARFKQWIKEMPVASRAIPSPDAKTPDLYLPYQFITDPQLGVKLSDMRMKLYLYLLKKWEENKRKTIELNYEDAANFIGIGGQKRIVYRRNINRILHELQQRFKLLTFRLERNQPARIDLLSYTDKRMSYNPDPKDCIAIPGSFWEFGWAQRLGVSAKYFYFISIIETGKTADLNKWWTDSQKHLYKKYNADPRILSEGSIELNRYNLLKTQYGDLIFPFTKYLTAPKYLQLPLYSWEWHQEELLKLKQYYGEQKVKIAVKWAAVVLEENNLAVIEKLINYFNEYGGALVNYAVDKVSLKRVGNPKRSFDYIEGIILKYIQEQKEETEE